MAHDLRFESHVIVTLSALPESASLGLANLVAPLRSSNIRYADLKDIVLLLRDTQFIRQKEWHELCHFPKLYVFVVSECNNNNNNNNNNKSLFQTPFGPYTQKRK